MRAIVREKYGSPDVLELKEIERPVIDDDSMLVRVRAASINAYDWHMMRGLPFLAKNSSEDLIVLKGLIEAGKLRPVVDQTYPLSETPAAMRYLEEGHPRGKVVITV